MLDGLNGFLCFFLCFFSHFGLLVFAPFDKLRERFLFKLLYPEPVEGGECQAAVFLVPSSTIFSKSSNFLHFIACFRSPFNVSG